MNNKRLCFPRSCQPVSAFLLRTKKCDTNILLAVTLESNLRLYSYFTFRKSFCSIWSDTLRSQLDSSEKFPVFDFESRVGFPFACYRSSSGRLEAILSLEWDVVISYHCCRPEVACYLTSSVDRQLNFPRNSSFLRIKGEFSKAWSKAKPIMFFKSSQNMVILYDWYLQEKMNPWIKDRIEKLD